MLANYINGVQSFNKMNILPELKISDYKTNKIIEYFNNNFYKNFYVFITKDKTIDVDILYDIFINKNIEYEDPKYYGYIGNMFYIDKNYQLAEKYYTITYGDAYKYVCLGEMYYDQKKFEMAEKYYHMAAEHSDECCFYLGKYYIEQKKYDLARRYLLNAIDNNVVDYDLHLSELEKNIVNSTEKLHE